MRILFVTDLCPIEKNEKGLPLTLLNFILDFKKLGHEVVLLRPNIIPNIKIRGRKILKEGEYEFKGIECINLNFNTPFFKVSRFEFLKNYNFDVILSHMPSGIMAAHKISKLIDTPYFAAVHSSDIKVLKDFKYFLLRNLMKKAYKNACGVLARSYWLKEAIENIIPEVKGKTDVILSGINSNILIEREKINLKADKFYGLPYKILSVGTLIKRKNFENLIKAVSMTEDTELLIIGSGKEEKNLKKLIKKLNLKKRVKLLGQKTNEEVLRFMEENTLFMLPSINETFGMVCLEAMAKGCIVVCSKNSGLSGFIKDGYNGFLTDTNARSIAWNIKRITGLKNPEIIMNRALDTAIETEELKMAEKYLKLIQNIHF